MRLRRLILAPVVIAVTACSTSVAAPPSNCVNTAPGASVQPSSATLSVGDTLRLAAALPPGCTGTLPTPVWRWSSSNAAVARVDSLTGLVTAVGPGTTAISAAPTFDPTIRGTSTVRVLP